MLGRAESPTESPSRPREAARLTKTRTLASRTAAFQDRQSLHAADEDEVLVAAQVAGPDTTGSVEADCKGKGRMNEVKQLVPTGLGPPGDRVRPTGPNSAAPTVLWLCGHLHRRMLTIKSNQKSAKQYFEGPA